MSVVGIAERTIRDVLYNDHLGLTHFVSAGAVAAIVNYVAHKVFQAKKSSWLSTALTFTAIGAGFAVSLYVCPTATLVSFAGLQALKWVATMWSGAFVIGLAIWLVFRRVCALPVGGGSLVGYIGPTLLHALGFSGACTGAHFGAKFA